VICSRTHKNFNGNNGWQKITRILRNSHLVCKSFIVIGSSIVAV
jgi:hypothetical protein